MNKIETVIFDVGGVLHESNSAVQDDLVEELGLSKETLARIWAEQIPLLGSGKIDEAEFWLQVSAQHGLRHVALDENLLGRAFAERLVPYTQTLAIVQDLGTLGLKTAILSNTIEPHARALQAAGIYKNFDTVLLSHEVGLRKPDRRIYEYALEALETAADQTVFIDDDRKNAEAATAVGMHNIVFSGPEQLREELERLIPELGPR